MTRSPLGKSHTHKAQYAFFLALTASGILSACGSSSDENDGPVVAPAAEAGDAVSEGQVLTDAADSATDTGEGSAEAADAGLDADAAQDSGGLVWQACSGGFSGACTNLSMPLDYANEQGPSLTVYVNLIASSTHSRAQLWVLQGGPGGSGSDMISLGRQVAQELPDIDVYTIDHRGVNRSSVLACDPKPEIPDAGAPDASPGETYAQAWKPCTEALQAKWGEGLKQFTTSNAARDLARAIELTRRPGQDVYVYGASYGTYWALRYLQLFPNQPSAVVLDSVVAPDLQLLSDWDKTTNQGIARWVEACKQDTTCKAKLGDDPEARLKTIAALSGTGHCPEFDSGLRVQLAPLFQYSLTGPYAIAAMYRYERCEPADVQALQTLLQAAKGFTALPVTFSEVLFNHVAYSELWELPAPSYEDLQARAAGVLFPSGADVQATLGQRWPVYPLDDYARKYPSTTLPVLMMNGTLDIQTPIDLASKAGPHLSGPGQTFVTFPGANHGVVVQSATTSGQSCGLQVMTSFLADPSAEPDTSCLAEIAPPDFKGQAANNVYLFGTEDLWENKKGASKPLQAQAPTPLLLWTLDKLRRGPYRL